MKNIKSLFAILLLMTVGFTSCLKDENIENQEYGMINLNANKIIEIPTGSSHSIATALIVKDEETVLNAFSVALAAENSATEDIEVTFTDAQSTEIVNSWNTKNPSNKVQVFPKSLYSFAGNKAVIPSGAKTSEAVKLSFNKKVLDPSLPYAIGVRIASVDKDGYVISGNFKDVLLRFPAKSEWDGTYSFTSIVTGKANATTTDEPEKMPTVNINTVSKTNIGEYFGGYTTYTFNADGTISVGAFNAAGGSSYGANVVESSFDRTTHNFHVKFTILGGGYTFDETAVRK